MKKIKKHIYKAVMYFSFQEREKREFSNYQKEYTRLKELPEDELTARYILIKAKYRFKKNLFLFFILAVLVTAFSVWSFCFSFSVADIASNQTDIAEAVKAVLLIFGISFTAMIIAVAVTVIFCLRALRDLNKTLLMIEEIRKNQENSCV